MRIGDYSKRTAPYSEEFWDRPEAAEDAGQDKLRAAVEWGIYRKFSRLNPRDHSLLNLKRSLVDGFFSHDGKIPAMRECPDPPFPESWLAGIGSGSIAEIFAFDFFRWHPDWQEGIGRLARMLKSDGLLFLDFFSEAHFRPAGTLTRSDGLTRLDKIAAIPAALVSPGLVSETARAHGLTVRQVIPYSSFYGNSLLVDMMRSRFRWERILDWFSSRKPLFDLGLFLEESLVAKMGTGAAPKFAVVLEKTGRIDTDPAILERETEWLPDSLPFSAATLSRFAGSGGGRLPALPMLKESLSAHLAEIPNRLFLLHLLQACGADLQGSEWDMLLPKERIEEYRHWGGQEHADEACTRTLRGWHRIPEIDKVLRHRDSPLGPGMEYGQMPEMLKDVFGYFREKNPE